MKKINGLLLAEQLGVSPNTITPSFMGYRVELHFIVEISSQSNPSQTYRIAQTRRVICDSDGEFTLEFEEDLEFADGTAQIKVFAPTGARLFNQSYPQGALNVSTGAAGTDDESVPIEITVSPITINQDPGGSQPTNITRGRIIRYCGQSLDEKTEILFWGCTESEPLVETETEEVHPTLDQSCQIVATTNVSADGSFALQTPTEEFDYAWIQWGARPDQFAKVTLSNDGNWPSTITLVEAINFHGEDSSKPQDCTCGDKSIARLPSANDLANDEGTYSSDLGTGGCQVHFKPNRTLEEFSYCSFVRTTEPSIAREEIGVTGLYKVRAKLMSFTRDFGVTLKSLSKMTDQLMVEATSDSIEAEVKKTKHKAKQQNKTSRKSSPIGGQNAK